MFDPNTLEALRAALPDHRVEIVEETYAFIFGGSLGDEPPVYLVFDDGPTTVRHQYNGACCDQFESPNCTLIAVHGPQAELLADLLGPYPDSEAIEAALRVWLPDASVDNWPREALVRAKSEMLGGSFYLTCCSSD